MAKKKTPNFHSIDIKSDKFENTRIILIDKDRGIKAFVGVDGNKYTVLSYQFSKTKFTLKEAKIWIKESKASATLQEYTEIKVKASIVDDADEETLAKAGIKKNKDLMYVELVLCHANVNSNQDEFEFEELKSAYDTIQLKPINIEHCDDDIVGVIYASEFIEESGLATEEESEPALVKAYGAIYKKKFPAVAEEMKKRFAENDLFYSMETWFNTAACSDCEEEFTTSDDYCDHLNSRHETKTTSRMLRGITFGGVAIVNYPADKEARNLTLAKKDIEWVKEVAEETMSREEKKEEEIKSYHDIDDAEELLDKSLMEIVNEDEEEQKRNRAYWSYTDILWIILRADESDISKEEKLNKIIEITTDLLKIYNIIENGGGIMSNEKDQDKITFKTKDDFDKEVEKATSPLNKDLKDLKESMADLTTKFEDLTKDYENLETEKDGIDKDYKEYKESIESEKILEARLAKLVEKGYDKKEIKNEDFRVVIADLSDKAFELLQDKLVPVKASNEDTETKIKEDEALANLSSKDNDEKLTPAQSLGEVFKSLSFQDREVK